MSMVFCYGPMTKQALRVAGRPSFAQAEFQPHFIGPYLTKGCVLIAACLVYFMLAT